MQKKMGAAMELNLRVLKEEEKRDRDRLSQVANMPAGAIDDGFRIIRNEIKAAWAEGDVVGVLMWLDNTAELDFVSDNQHTLIERGLYEEALLNAYQDTRTNFRAWDPWKIQHLFSMADPVKLREAGDRIPERDRYVLFRGVAGRGRARRVNGISWTDSPEVAMWFAKRYGLDDPAVFTITVLHDQILAYLSERNEAEYLLKLPLPMKPKRMK